MNDKSHEHREQGTATEGPFPLILDHIAVSARSLDDGVAHVREALGIDVPPGGEHPIMGTHNHLMALGPDLFLEVIAVDPDAAPPGRARWFGLDTFRGPPQLGTWVLATDDIRLALHAMPVTLGRAVPITRGDLSWLISVPDDGSMPYEGAFPTLIEWPDGTPASRMPDLGCRLRSLTIEHPEAAVIEAALADRLDDPRIRIRVGSVKAIRAEIETPNGLRTLI